MFQLAKELPRQPRPGGGEGGSGGVTFLIGGGGGRRRKTRPSTSGPAMNGARYASSNSGITIRVAPGSDGHEHRQAPDDEDIQPDRAP